MRVFDEAEAIAGARWQATESKASRRERLAAPLLAEVEAILARRWAETEPTHRGDVQAEVASIGWAQATNGPTTYRLFDGGGQPIRCHLCGHDDHWVPEGDAERQIVRMFVCEHEPLRIGQGLIRQVSTVALSRVIRCEVVHSA